MKKVLAMVAGLLLMASMVKAAGDNAFVFPIFTVSSSVTNATVSQTWTNEVGERILVNSLWIRGSILTNGTFQLLNPIPPANTSFVTIDLPVSSVGGTVYYTPPQGALWIEPTGKIAFTGLLSATGTATTVFSVYATRPTK